MTTINQALSGARHRLQASSPGPATDAGILLCHVLACSRSHLIAWPEKELSEAQATRFGELVQQRIGGTPVAYITGEKEFWSLVLKVTPTVLIPRPETETLVEFVLDIFAGRPAQKIVDLGTGSGAIACALAKEHPDWQILATDTSAEALSIAQQNAAMHKLDNIAFLRGSWLDPLRNDDFDLIISNPPYVADSDPHLSQGDVRFEPGGALSSGKQGMDDINVITRQAGSRLKPGGWLVIEHGYDQKQAVLDCFLSNSFTDIEQHTDLADIPRMTAGRNPE